MNERELEDFGLGIEAHRKPYSRPPERNTDTTEIYGADVDGGADDKERSGAFRIPDAGANGEHGRRDDMGAPVRLWSSPAYQGHIRTSRYSGRSASFSSHAPLEAAKREEAENDEPLLEYGSDGMISCVKIKRWSGGAGLYEKNARDAYRSHMTKPPASPVPHVPYFSYIPKYSTLTPPQREYYLYFREAARCGEVLPEAEFSYVMLYIYEIINLDGVLPPSEAAETLGRLWSAYRRRDPVIDKYMAEWMADFCLIHRLPLPDTVFPFAAEAAGHSTLKEFYFDAVLERSDMTGAARLLMETMSDYSIERSRSIKTIENFRERLVERLDTMLPVMLEGKIGFFSPSLVKEANVKRDAYSGSLCACSVKKRLELALRTPLRSVETRRLVTDIIRGCENLLRAENGVRARLSTPSIGESGMRGMFDEMMSCAASSKSKRRGEEPEYLKLYDVPDEPMTAARAAEIEAESWKNTALLTEDDALYPDGDAEDEDLGFCDEPVGALCPNDFDVADAEDSGERKECGETDADESCGSVSSFARRLKDADAALYRVFYSAVSAARGEVGASFSEGCRSAGLFADDAASRINELAAEELGDILLERSESGYNIIEDYLDEL